ncbi:olfactory receptor 14A16-like [Anolis carolinensis]|uniref:olfactory receptor 14A16-like n=1 Tax=Anolis carolinensis TaxID=28377 RepID=UPI0007DB715F|nr:PREDICTED: olfactory receptor 14A16-like [Anolis carolinensis]|eukprot:XP_016851325.1 PREDICTED: olfactory receptor 14A16-like [Anolis carolinensis]
MYNHTSTSSFLLLEFSTIRGLQILHFFVFLAMYLIAVIGNLFIIIAVVTDYQLHIPMYFFLFCLAMVDLGSVSVTIPKSMAMSLMNDRSISFSGCIAQVFFSFLFITSDFVLLNIMTHDRHVAICNPLHYERIMNKPACVKMLAIGLIISLLYATLHTSGTFMNTFCSNNINQFFCEVPQLLKLSCSDLYLVEFGLLVLSCTVALGCFIFIIITYVQIFSAVLRILSVHGQKKALFTCVPHLIVVSLLLITGAFSYARPPSDISSSLDLGFAVMYSIIPPMSNPFIIV